MIIDVQDLTKRYGGLLAVDKVNFAVEQGEIFGFLGPNGAGKTTCLEMMEGLRKPDGGQVLLKGIYWLIHACSCATAARFSGILLFRSFL